MCGKKSEKHKRDGEACSGFSTNISTFIRNCLACTRTHTQTDYEDHPRNQMDGRQMQVFYSVETYASDS